MCVSDFLKIYKLPTSDIELEDFKMLRYEMMANPCPVAICWAAVIAICQLQSEMKVTLGPPCLGQALLCIQQVNIFS